MPSTKQGTVTTNKNTEKLQATYLLRSERLLYGDPIYWGKSCCNCMKKGSLKIGRKYSAANMIAYRYLTPTVKPERSYPGETRLSLSYVKIRITVHVTRHFAVRKLNELKRQESKRQNRRQSAKHVKLQSNLMQAGKERTFDSSGFSVEGCFKFLHLRLRIER